MPVEDLEWALAAHREAPRLRAYGRARDYYDGRHDLTFAKKRFADVFKRRFQEVADNLCPAVVDSVADRLRITDFTASARSQEPLARRARVIWRRNRMAQRANEVHRESLLTGDGYAIVWPDDTGQAAIWPQRADEIHVDYSEVRPGELVRAARVWRQRDRRIRVNVYLPDRIEKYVTPDGKPQLTVRRLRELDEDAVVENPFGRVPVFHFPNKRLFDYGISELADVLPLQDALNKAVSDMLVAMELSAFRQRWVTGLELDGDEESREPTNPPFRPGIDRIWAAESDKTKFGEFEETDLEQFLKVQEDLRAEIARVSGTPLHYLFITRGDFPSGEAMKSAEARFTEKLIDRQDTHGPVWQELLRFALLVEGARVPPAFELAVQWASAAPRSDEEVARTATMKRELGVSRRQALKELGYDEETIDRMLAEEPVPAAAGPPIDAGA